MSGLLAGPRRWWLFGGIVAILLLLVGWMLLISPQQSATGEAAQKAQQVDQQVTVATAQLAQLKQQSADLDRARAELEALESRIPDRDQMSALLVKADDAARSSGVALVGLAPGTVVALDSSAPDKGTDRLGYINVAINGEGGYDQLQVYLTKLENLDRAFMIASLDVTGGEGGSSPAAGPVPLTFTIQARVFVKGEIVPAPAGSAAPPGGASSGGGAK